MKRALVLVIALASAGTAAAEKQGNFDDAPTNPLVTPWRPRPTYIISDPGIPVLTGDQVHAHPQFSNKIYLANCKPNGCLINPGGNNSTATPPISSVPDNQSMVRPFAYSDAVWQQVVACVKQTYSPFGVEIVDQRPTSGNYHMAVVAGYPEDVGMQQGVGGVSPFSCGYIPNAVSFSFANVYGGNVDDICWTVAQETAHSWGLDHKYDNRDPMTYLSSGPSRKNFQNQAGPCGEFSARSCQCGGSTMNSFQEIVETFGGSTPTPPTGKINEPAEGAIVAPMFAIKAALMDDVAITKAELRIDNMLIGTLNMANAQGVWAWTAPASLKQGAHKIVITAYDVANTPAHFTVNVSQGMACVKSGDCDLETDWCVEGRCVVGGGEQGGLGATCTMNVECASGQCAMDVEGEAHCVENCSVSAQACPSDFECLSIGVEDMGVCWPKDDTGGCSSSGSTPGMLLLVGLGMVLVVRRRRR